NWPALGPLISGDALTSLEAAIPAINQAGAVDTLANVSVSPEWVSPNGQLAVAEAHYQLTRSVTSTGTSVSDVTATFELAQIAGHWRIYSVSTVMDQPVP
ncbi:hypothetical protein, partial [Methylacidiphilum caldifontis]|uniref:hypothetical protein n=1 Tax=Methylacidiphilum caldifontis TaxID=2795386 RepID=UPI00141BD18E